MYTVQYGIRVRLGVQQARCHRFHVSIPGRPASNTSERGIHRRRNPSFQTIAYSDSTQNAPTTTSLPRLTIPSVIRATYRNEGFLAFYKGLGTNALRILPGTCTTLVVYENLVWGFRSLAMGRRKEGDDRIL